MMSSSGLASELRSPIHSYDDCIKKSSIASYSLIRFSRQPSSVAYDDNSKALNMLGSLQRINKKVIYSTDNKKYPKTR